MALVIKSLPANAGDIRDADSIPELERFPWRRAWQPTPVFLPGESQGQGSLVGFSPWCCKESDMNEATEHACVHVIKKDKFELTCEFSYRVPQYCLCKQQI